MRGQLGGHSTYTGPAVDRLAEGHPVTWGCDPSSFGGQTNRGPLFVWAQVTGVTKRIPSNPLTSAVFRSRPANRAEPGNRVRPVTPLPRHPSVEEQRRGGAAWHPVPGCQRAQMAKRPVRARHEREKFPRGSIRSSLRFARERGVGPEGAGPRSGGRAAASRQGRISGARSALI
jgi:hypothetical protein